MTPSYFESNFGQTELILHLGHKGLNIKLKVNSCCSTETKGLYSFQGEGRIEKEEYIGRSQFALNSVLRFV